MYLASEVHERSNVPVPGQRLETKVGKSHTIPPYLPRVNPPGWPLMSALPSDDDINKGEFQCKQVWPFGSKGKLEFQFNLWTSSAQIFLSLGESLVYL